MNVDNVYFNKKQCNVKYRCIQKGDKVEFQVNWLQLNPICENVTFVHNLSFENLKIDFQKKKILTGKLYRIDNKYFVKDKETKILIKLKISDYEVNIEDNYEYKVGSMIEYKILYISKNNRIRAINCNQIFFKGFNFGAVGFYLQEGFIQGNAWFQQIEFHRVNL